MSGRYDNDEDEEAERKRQQREREKMSLIDRLLGRPPRKILSCTC